MNATTILFSLLVLVITLVGLAVIVHLAKRLNGVENRLSRANDALMKWAAILGENLSPDAPRLDLSSRICNLCMQEFSSNGSLLLGPVNTEQEQPRFPVWGTAGICRDWFADQTIWDEQEVPLIELSVDVKRHFFWSREPLLFAGEVARQWVPREWSDNIAGALAAPIHMPDKQRGVLLVLRTPQQPMFGRSDLSVLSVVVQLAETRFRILNLREQVKALEEQVQHAHEEGMLQISSGIIHNIGNAVTVIQLRVDRLCGSSLRSAGELATFLDEELLPVLDEKVAERTLASYLQDDPQGASYLQSLHDVSAELRRKISSCEIEGSDLTAKFEDVVEVIALQQRYIGELGTENVVSIATILRDIEKATKPVVEQREIPFHLEQETQSRVLVDPAMLQHVMLLLIKQSIEAVTATQKAANGITIRSYNETADDRDWVVVEIQDTGYRPNLELDQLPDSPPAGTMQTLRDFQFSRQRIEKYGGRFAVATKLDSGTTVRLHLPRYRD